MRPWIAIITFLIDQSRTKVIATSITIVINVLGMEPGEIIRRAREAKGWSQRELSGRIGISQPAIKKIEAGETTQSKFLPKIAQVLGIDLSSLDDSLAPGAIVTAHEPHKVKVVGRIGAGAEILPEAEQVPPEGLFEIEIPFPVPEATLAFEVEGDSMWPRYDAGDVVLCWKEGTNATEIIGWEAAVRTSDGRRFLKRILQGSRARHYDLESYNAPVIRNVKLEWASKVQLVVRAGEWKQLARPHSGAFSCPHHRGVCGAVQEFLPIR